MRKDIERELEDCNASLVTGKNPKNQIPKNQQVKLKKPTKRGQKLLIDFTGKLPNKNVNGEPEFLIAIDRFSKIPTAKVCKTT